MRKAKRVWLWPQMKQRNQPNIYNKQSGSQLAIELARSLARQSPARSTHCCVLCAICVQEMRVKLQIISKGAWSQNALAQRANKRTNVNEAKS